MPHPDTGGVHPRPIFQGATYMVTRRTTQRQFLLGPSKELSQAFRYCLALAVQKSGVLVHAVVVLSNHYHIVCTDPNGSLPIFTRELNRLVAKCFNAYHSRSENFWAASVQPSYVLLADDDAVLSKTIYALVNPVAAGLVKSGSEWPGELLFQPASYRARRPEFFFRGGKTRRTLPATLELEIVPPPIGNDACAAMRLVRDAVRAEEKAIRIRFKREGRSFLGAARLGRQEPSDTPKCAKAVRGLSPKFACRDRSRRLELIEVFKAFVQEHRAARELWVSGVRTVAFPRGTYGMRVQHGVRCAES